MAYNELVLMIMIIGWALIITIIFVVGMIEMRESRETDRKRINFFIENHKCNHHGEREETEETKGSSTGES